MENKQISISIIVPIYKIRENYLRQCIDSLINQTLRDIEIILIDDGSPDNDGVICDEYGKADDRIVVIHQQNQGVSMARNAGMEAARGTYIMFVDPDDWVEPDCCSRILQVANDGQWDVVYFQSDNNDGNGCHIRSYPPIGSFALDRNDLQKMQSDGLASYSTSFGFESMGPWGKLYRRAFVNQNHCRFPAGIKRRQDQIFNLYCLDFLDSAYFCDYTGYHYRENEDSICRRYNPEMMSILRSFFHEAEKFVKERHANDNSFEHLLGALAINMLADFEWIYFSPKQPTSYKDYLKYMDQYYGDPIVKKYIKQCRLSDMRTLAKKVKFVLLSGRHLFVYYCIQQARKTVRGWA